MRAPARIRLAVAVAGAGGIATLVVAILVGRQEMFGRPAVLAAFAVALALSHAFPLVLLHREETEGLQLDEAFLVAAALLFPRAGVILMFAVGLLAGHLARRRGALKTVFNVGETLSAAGLAVLAMSAVGSPQGPLDPRDVAAVLAGVAVFLVAQSTAVSFVISLAEGRRFRESFVDGVALRLLVWVGTVSVGLLAGLVGSTYPWALTFAALPVAALQLAFSGHLRARHHRRHMVGLYGAAARAHASMGVEDVEQAITAAASELLRCRVARLDDEPPARDELGALLSSASRAGRWLVVSGRLGVEPFGAEDRELLEAIAAICADALDNAYLHRQVQDERRKLADVVSSSSDGIFAIDAEGHVALWNPAMERITGFGADLVPDVERLAMLSPAGPDGRELGAEAWRLPHGLSSDVQIVTSFGQTRWLRCSFSPMPAGGIAVVARDITQARETERMKDDFVATVTHELRTPLTPIKGWARTILQLGSGMTEGERTEALESILGQADRLERLITNLLEVARIQGQADDRPVVVVDARALVEKVAEQFRTTHPDRQIRIVAKTRRAMRAVGDPTRIEQILTNLLANALKYAPGAEPVDVRVSESPEVIEIAVVDRGPGISAQDREMIFERFRRLGDHLTRGSGGTGLGLYIARELAAAVGGSLTVEPTPGAGATFVLKLKAATKLSLVG